MFCLGSVGGYRVIHRARCLSAGQRSKHGRARRNGTCAACCRPHTELVCRDLMDTTDCGMVHRIGGLCLCCGHGLAHPVGEWRMARRRRVADQPHRLHASRENGCQMGRRAGPQDDPRYLLFRAASACGGGLDCCDAEPALRLSYRPRRWNPSPDATAGPSRRSDAAGSGPPPSRARGQG